MLLERINEFRRSLLFRFTVLYTAMFTISSFVAFIVFYEMMISRTHGGTDGTLKSKMKEVSSLLGSKDIEAFRKGIINEAESMGTNKIFFRLLTAEGHEIMSTDLSSWNQIGTRGIAFEQLALKPFAFETVKPPGWKYKVRVLHGKVGPGMVLQIGLSLRDDEYFLQEIREVFETAMATAFVFAILGGWLMARRSIAGIDRLTQTAMAISDGAIERRVPLTGRGDEIDRLSGVFNRMIERIQSLIKGMREITDNVAHDLRSPVARIRGSAELALATERSVGGYHAMAENIVEECDQLLRMINTMLEISEAEAEAGSLNLSEVDVSALVQDACDLFQPWAEEKGLRFEVNIAAQCLLHCDRNKLQRVIANLLDNAIKYTPTGGRINVLLEKNDKEVTLSVRDTGIGMSQEEIPKIFDRFFRADKSRSVSGAGLGLSLVRAIVQKHRGEIKISSSPGTGSTFTVVLPKTSTPE